MANNHFQIAFEVPCDDPQAAIDAIAAEINEIDEFAEIDVDYESPIFGTLDMGYLGAPHIEPTELDGRPGLYIAGDNEEPISAVCEWLLGQPGVPDEIEYTWAARGTHRAPPVAADRGPGGEPVRGRRAGRRRSRARHPAGHRRPRHMGGILMTDNMTTPTTFGALAPGDRFRLNPAGEVWSKTARSLCDGPGVGSGYAIADDRPVWPLTDSEYLEHLRGEIRGECISWGELADLQDMAELIDPGDVELLEWAGVPEQPDERAAFFAERAREEAAERVRRYLAKHDEVWPDGDPRFDGGTGCGYTDAPLLIADLRTLSTPTPNEEP